MSDLSLLDLVKAEIEQLEGFKASHDEVDLTVTHYGTEVGNLRHNQYEELEIEQKLIGELAKDDFDLEAFLVENDIDYQVIKPNQNKFNFSLDLFIFTWDGWWRPNSGTINGQYFCHHHNDLHGNYINLVFNNQIYLSFSSNIPDHIKPYFDKIWQLLEETGYIRFPREISLGSKVTARLPDGFKAYKTDDDDQCRVARNTQKYCYIKRFRDCEWYVSPTENYQLMAKQTDSILTLT